MASGGSGRGRAIDHATMRSGNSMMPCASCSANSYDTSRWPRSSTVTEIEPFGIGKRSPKRAAQIGPAEAVDFVERIADRIQRQQRRLRVEIARERLDFRPQSPDSCTGAARLPSRNADRARRRRRTRAFAARDVAIRVRCAASARRALRASRRGSRVRFASMSPVRRASMTGCDERRRDRGNCG